MLMCAILTNGKAYIYELQTWYTNGGRPASATGAMISQVKGQGHVISLSRVGPSSYLICQWPINTNSRSITKTGRRVPHDTCYIAHQFQDQKVKLKGQVTGRLTQNVPCLPNGKA